MQSTVANGRCLGGGQDIIPVREIGAGVGSVIMDKLLCGQPFSTGYFIYWHNTWATNQNRFFIHQPGFIYPRPVAFAATHAQIRFAMSNIHQLFRHVQA